MVCQEAAGVLLESSVIKSEKNYLDLFCREKNMAKPNIELMTVRDIPILVGYEVMLGYISRSLLMGTSGFTMDYGN